MSHRVVMWATSSLGGCQLILMSARHSTVSFSFWEKNQLLPSRRLTCRSNCSQLSASSARCRPDRSGRRGAAGACSAEKGAGMESDGSSICCRALDAAGHDWSRPLVESARATSMDRREVYRVVGHAHFAGDDPATDITVLVHFDVPSKHLSLPRFFGRWGSRSHLDDQTTWILGFQGHCPVAQGLEQVLSQYQVPKGPFRGKHSNERVKPDLCLL